MQKKRDIVLVDKRMAARPDKVQSRNKEEATVKTTYNVYSDAQIRGCKNRDKRKEMYHQLNKAENKERKEKTRLTQDFLPGKGSNVLMEEMRLAQAQENGAKPAKTNNNSKKDELDDDSNEEVKEKPAKERQVKVAQTFFDLPISDRTKEGLLQAGFSKMTVIQKASIPYAIADRDVLGAAKTGSGKTLAFLVPMFERLWRNKVTQEAGLAAVILTPTRELAVQIFEVLRVVGKFHDSLSAGLLIGGPKNYKEEVRAVGCMNILVATPGRLLQHLSESGIETTNFEFLVFDEADKMMDMGFKKEVDAILEYLPAERQTLCFSATQTASVTQLARLALNDAEYVAAHAQATQFTPNTLQQFYAVVPLHEKTNVLWSFLKSHKRDKIMIFFASQKQVKYYFEAFKKLNAGIRLLHLHGNMSQDTRTNIYFDYNGQLSGGVALFTTDIAARGLDFEKVEWIIQFDCPEDTNSYIHRVGRTARKEEEGKALMLLLPSETALIADLEARKVPLSKIDLNPSKQQDIRLALQDECIKDPKRKILAQKCVRSYVRAVDIGDKRYFKREGLSLDQYAQSIGLLTCPHLEDHYEKFDKNEARLLDQMNQLVQAQEEAEKLGLDIPLVLKKKRKTQSEMLLKRKNTDILSKSAQSLVEKNDEDQDDDVFVKKTENKFHELMDVDNLVLDPSKRSTLTLDDLALPLDDKGDDYYEQVEEQMFEQDELDRRAAVKKKHEKKSIVKQRRKNYEEYILKPKLEAQKKQEELDKAHRPKRSGDGRDNTHDGMREKKKQKMHD